jgi:heme-degrading monooxygenase HmoA
MGVRRAERAGATLMDVANDQAPPMKNFLAPLLLASGLALTSAATAQPSGTQTSLPPEAVTVVIQISLVPGARSDVALPVMNDMRALIRKQPGFLAEEFLENANPANSPRNVHVTRWASFKHWESVFASPEFAKLYAEGAKQYTITTSAFKTVK